MFASLQNVLPSSVLSSLSNNPAAKNQPHQAAGDIPDRDSLPSSSNNKPMNVDEQGVKRKKGRSNEVSPSPSQRKRHNPRMRSLQLRPVLRSRISDHSTCRHSSSFVHHPQRRTTLLTFRYNSYHQTLVITNDQSHPAVHPNPWPQIPKQTVNTPLLALPPIVLTSQITPLAMLNPSPLSPLSVLQRQPDG